VQSVKRGFEIVGVRKQMADVPDHDGISLYDVIQPEVVNHPGTALDCHSPNHFMHFRETRISVGKSWAIQRSIGRIRPGNSARSCRIEEMDMAVHDGNPKFRLFR
jgi:hypothetical protein